MYHSNNSENPNANNRSVFSERFDQNLETVSTVDKENILPYNYQAVNKGMHTSHSSNVSIKNGFYNGANNNTVNNSINNFATGNMNASNHHRTVLSDVTAQVNNKLNSVPSNSTVKSDGSTNSNVSTTTNSTNSVEIRSNDSNMNNNTQDPCVNRKRSPSVLHEEINDENDSASHPNSPTTSSDIVDHDKNEEEGEPATNEYAGIEEDDDNEVMRSPLIPLQDFSDYQILREAYEEYHSDTLDLMDEDTYDVVMVAELADGIFDYLRELEEKYKPDPNFIHFQPELKWSYRRISIDWIVEVHNRFQLLPETLYLTVNIIDRFLSKKKVILNKFQLVGAAALFIAAKYEEINCPSLKDIIYMLNEAYTREEVIEAEKYIIDSLEFEIGWPGPMSFLRRISKADDYDYEIRTLAKYLLESTIMESRFVALEPSWLAAASYFLSRLILNFPEWSLKHVYYSGYTEKQLVKVCTIILENCKDASLFHKAIEKKYSTSRQHNSAQLVHKWIELSTRRNTDNNSDDDF
ncbi:hypothetical protein C6P45_001363 [Maudiozyma exigua]|uniref:Cyclin N-terminal domain-containing protein n=1 Tax=Maudiozyma exigua TaxID=34358 RepID=A0A9P6WDU8_MAUEX|nr:hypothetical protein C6P45_001363 [Kazachstania exigua]